MHTQTRRAVVQSYIEGLFWVAQYYHGGVGSWGWFYPAHYAPLASDLVDLAGLDITFEPGRPYTPLMQVRIELRRETCIHA